MNELEHRLRTVPEPPLPEGLAAGVAARIARLNADSAAPGIAQPRRSIVRDHMALAAALLGLVLAFGAETYRLLAGETVVDLIAPLATGGLQGVVTMLPATPAVATFVAGTLLYAAGLLAIVRDMPVRR